MADQTGRKRTPSPLRRRKDPVANTSALLDARLQLGVDEAGQDEPDALKAKMKTLMEKVRGLVRNTVKLFEMR